jgi:hypothetical protein
LNIAGRYAIDGGHTVMAGHSRSKNGVAPLAYVPAIHVFVRTDG